MALFLRIDINIVAMLLVAIILFSANRRLDKTDSMNRSFLLTSAVVLVELGFETVTCILNHRPEAWIPAATIVLHICLFAIAPLLSYSWYYLICNWVRPALLSQNLRKILFIPVPVNAILTFLSPAYHFVFFIDSTNTYHRGSLFSFFFCDYVLLFFSCTIANHSASKQSNQSGIYSFDYFWNNPPSGWHFASCFLWNSTDVEWCRICPRHRIHLSSAEDDTA